MLQVKPIAPSGRPVAPRSKLARVPELRQLFDAGHDYLQGRASLYQLHARVCHLRLLAKAAGAAPAVIALLDEWAGRVERRWSAWALAARVQTESEFSAWLQAQLVFDRPDVKTPELKASKVARSP
ncbi:hypothetical protein [Variovorax sp. J31P207]|uniref:hypothetical protein n=1 Tax=Variovorax sp. J31P207 TaxID=3053510 RepID=UPI00257555AB|nr:hypothetical protein [Variovorax sp. J31P207]MDM0072717.1 hypothetical protein [Variovorax sp. J31P207]